MTVPCQTLKSRADASPPSMRSLLGGALAALSLLLSAGPSLAQRGADDAYRPPAQDWDRTPVDRGYGRQPPPPAYEPVAPPQGYGRDAPRDGAGYEPPPQQGYGDTDRRSQSQGYGQSYSAPPPDDGPPPPRSDRSPMGGYYEQGEIVEKGRGFFGSVSQGLASAIEHTYRKSGRPNGYVLGDDGGGAFFAGLRYGEGTLYTKDAGDHRVFWQGPSLGYDVGGDGSKVMVLVYNLQDPSDVFQRFGGVEGSAYVVGGVSVQFQTGEGVTLAVIRSGVGLRLGANVGYTKYTRRPTWNPF